MTTILPPPRPDAATTTPRWVQLWPLALIVVTALAAYSNTFSVPFLFDDQTSIIDNPAIRHLWGGAVERSPADASGLTTSGRPVVRLTLAINYALGGTAVGGYHAVNLAIHLLAGLTLFGLVRRTLALRVGGQACCAARVGGSLVTDDRPQAGLLRSDPTLPALAVALGWILHPIQTEAVTYIVQRTEALVGLFYLLTVYCFNRGATCQLLDDRSATRRAAFWYALSVGACLFGMAAKEVMVTAPIVVFLYDRTFFAGSFRAAWQRRRWVYGGLAATWVPLAWFVASTGGNRGGTSGFNVGIPWSSYWLTQFEALTRYAWLSVWPHPLVFEYGTIWAHGFGEVVPYAVVGLLLAGATLLAIWRSPVAGFLGACCFAILAPTSLVPGTIQMVVEHRMYLPLAAVVSLVFCGAIRWAGRPGLLACLVVALGWGWLTHERNSDYRNELSLWTTTVSRRPESSRAQNNLGKALLSAGRPQEALSCFANALRIAPTDAKIHYNLALALGKLARAPEALAGYREAVRLDPNFAEAQVNLGMALVDLGRLVEALPHLEAAVKLKPALAEGQCGLANALAKSGRYAEAEAHYRQALALQADYPAAHYNLGNTLFLMRRPEEARREYRLAIEKDPGRSEYFFNLALTLAALGETDAARDACRQAVKLDPANAEAQLDYGIALAQAGRPSEALSRFEVAARLKPDLPEAQCNLGIAYAQAGRIAEAVECYERALRLKPDYAIAHYNYGNVLLELGRNGAAEAQFEEALRLEPNLDGAREVLGRLRAEDTPGR